MSARLLKNDWNGKCGPEQAVCCVPICGNIRGTFFKFPHPDGCPRAYHIWLRRIADRKLIGSKPNDVYQKNVICELHFDERCKKKSEEDNNQIQLVWGSLPTLNLPGYDGESNLSTYSLAEMIKLLQKTETNVTSTTTDDLKISEVYTVTKDNDIVETLPDLLPLMKSPQVAVTTNLKQLHHSDPPPLTKFKETIRSPPYLEGLKYCNGSDNDVIEVCRICLTSTTYFDSVQWRRCDEMQRMMPLVLPDLANEYIYKDAVICVDCVALIRHSYRLKSTFDATQVKFNQIVQSSKGPASELKEPPYLFILGSDTKHSDLLVHPNPDHDYHKPEVILMTSLDDNEVVLVPKTTYSRLSYKSNCRQAWRQRIADIAMPVLCHKCGKLLDTYTSLRRHVYHYTCDKNEMALKRAKYRDYLCPTCGKIFKRSSTYLAHIQRHEVPKFKCQLCPKAYHSRPQIKSHMKLFHMREYEYHQCHLCGTKLAYKSSFRMHMKIHEGDTARTHECPKCQMKFTVRSKMVRHMRRHMVREHTCEICGKVLGSQEGLRIHINVFHKGKGGTQCEICLKTYWKRCDMIRHMSRVHDVNVPSKLNKF